MVLNISVLLITKYCSYKYYLGYVAQYSPTPLLFLRFLMFAVFLRRQDMSMGPFSDAIMTKVTQLTLRGHSQIIQATLKGYDCTLRIECSPEVET